MFDFESKLRALVENYGLAYLLEDNEITEEFVIKFLIEERMISFEDYFNTDAEMQYLKEMEEWWALKNIKNTWTCTLIG